MDHFEEFNFCFKSIEENLLLLEYKFKNINNNIDISSKLHKVGNLISIFCYELYDELKTTKKHLENDLTCLNYNNILETKNYIIKELNIHNLIDFDINLSLNIIDKYLNIYFEDLKNNKENYELNYNFER